MKIHAPNRLWLIAALLLTWVALAIPAASAQASSSWLRRKTQLNITSNLENINEILEAVLPETNFDLRGSLEDPSPDLELDPVGIPLDCASGRLVLNIEMQNLEGLSSINLTSLAAVPGTEDRNRNCWSAAVDTLVEFSKDLVPGRTRASITGTCDGTTYNQPLSVSVRALNVTFTGRANMEGRLGPFRETIRSVDYLNTLTLGFMNFPATVALVPAALSSQQSVIEGQLQGALRQQLVNDIEPVVRERLESTIPDCNV